MQSLKPPQPLDLTGRNLGDNWKRFTQTFDLYMKASGADKKDDAIQTAIFLHVIGENALEVYNGFTWAEEGDELKLAKIREKFKDYCIPRTNVTFERHRFFTTVQKPGEAIDHFVTELRTRAKSCEFGTLLDGLIRDRVICGIPSNTLRQRLLREEKLTLEKAIDICRAEEATRSQVGQLSEGTGASASASTSCDAIHKKPYSGKSRGHNSRSQPVEKINCKKCGYKHNPKRCPAAEKSCMKCGKVGHFIKCCPKTDKHSSGQNVHAVETEYDEYEEYEEFFVDTVNSPNNTQSWIVPLDINGTVLPMKLDTGANANIISEHDYCSIKQKSKLHKSKVKLTAYAGHDVPVKGQCIMNIEHKGKVNKALFIVTEERVHPILGLQECEKLSLVRRVWQVDAENTDSSKTQTENTESRKKQTSDFCDRISTEYADVFSGLGCLPGTHKIRVDESVTPVVEPCRKVPFGLHDKLKKELDRMESLDVITKVDEPTEWVSSLVIVHKKSGDIRVCLDPKNLNKAIRREHFKLPTREEIMSKFAGAQVFSKLDASSGFWQLRLDEDSSKLCTFSTPFGRYRYLRLPFGISSAPEVYHRTIYNLFSEIPGVDTSMDDIIIQGDSQEQHDASLKQVLDRAREANLKLNADKCVISVRELTFIGDVVSDQGVKPDSTKVEAINAMDRPTNKKELQRFLGMVTYLAKFVPNLSTETAALRSLLHHKTQWEWQPEHENAWKRLKELLSSEPVLKFYDPKRPIKMSTDASQSGLGAVLLQLYDGEWSPVAYASRAMTETETRYAQIEKETLSIVFGCERFHQFIYGQTVIAETDHKPLVSIFAKSLAECPPRIQRLKLRLQKYDLRVTYTPGKHMYAADTLSRAYMKDTGSSDIDIEVQAYVDGVKATTCVSESRMKEIQEETQRDADLQLLTATLLNGWPNDRVNCPPELLEYWNYRDELSVIDGVIFKGNRILIPKSLRSEMLRQIHVGHLGIEKCRKRARVVMFWPRMNSDIANVVKNCEHCLTYRKQQQREPLNPHPITSRPWEKVSTDLFTYGKKDYLVVVDSYSNFPEVVVLSSASSVSVINAMKTIFARHGIPTEVFGDNGPCYNSAEFQQFAKDWGFTHNTSSPRYPKSNGLAERTVQTVKNIIRKAKESGEDPQLGLLAYRSTPINGLSPAQMLMGRRVRTNLPIRTSLLETSTQRKVIKKKMTSQDKQKYYHDRGTKKLSSLEPGSRVRVLSDEGKNWREKGVVIKEVANRSFMIQTDRGAELRRNRSALMKTSEPPPRPVMETAADKPARETTPDQQQSGIPEQTPVSNPSVDDKQSTCTTKSGREIRRPVRLIET